MKKILVTKLSILIFIISVSFDQISASEHYYFPEPPKERALLLTHNFSEDVFIIYKGDEIQFSVLEQKIKGCIDSISEHSIYVQNKEYKIINIDYIKTNTSGKKFKYSSIFFFNISVALFATSYLYSYYDPWFVLGFGQKLIGISLIIPAIIFFIADRLYRYDLKKRWKIESIEM